MPIRKLAHYSVRTPDLEVSRRFYTEVLGFKVGYRPAFAFPGLWLYCGGDEADFGVVHLIGIDKDAPRGLVDYLGDKAPESLTGGGAMDHLAFMATDLRGMRAALERATLAYRERTVPDLGLHQVFVEDPSGVTIELNFPAAEARSASAA